MRNVARPSSVLRKVPEITLLFWVVKLLTTALGESTSDYLVVRINPYLAVLLGGVCFAIALLLQFSVRKYVAWIYWLAVAMVAVFGTMAADATHIQLGIPYIFSTVVFAASLAVIFKLWDRTEGTLSIHSINSRRREIFYWIVVMATFALGTSAGDLTAITLGLGYLASAFLFAGLIALPALAYWKFGLSETTAFWSAYVLTRPLGASVADWMGKSKTVSGLGIGDLRVSTALVILIVTFICYMTFNRQEAKLETNAKTRS